MNNFDFKFCVQCGSMFSFQEYQILHNGLVMTKTYEIANWQILHHPGL